jgi:hypothetical protein
VVGYTYPRGYVGPGTAPAIIFVAAYISMCIYAIIFIAAYMRMCIYAIIFIAAYMLSYS